MVAPAWLTTTPIAHRGLHDEAANIIENTDGAFQAAISCGYAIECDVRLAADGVVVFHDEHLDRLTRATGPVAQHSLAELTKIRYSGCDETILSFDEFLQRIGGRVGLVIEIKADPWVHTVGLEEQIAKSLARYDGPVAVMSFSPRIMAHMRSLTPHLPRGLISARFDRADDRHGLSTLQRFQRRHLLDVPSVRPNFIAYDVNALPACAPMVLRQFGLPLLTWTVKTVQNRQNAHKYADQMIFEGFRPEV